jgi:hypothetical protein
MQVDVLDGYAIPTPLVASVVFGEEGGGFTTQRIHFAVFLPQGVPSRVKKGSMVT